MRREGRAAARRRVERKGFASFLSPERRNALGPNFGIQIFEGPKASASPETGGSPPIPLGKKPGDYFPQRQDQEGGVGREGEAEEAPSSEVSASAFRDLPPQRTSPPAAAPRNEPPSPSLAGASASPPSPTRAVIGQQSREGSPGAFDRVCAWVDGVSASPGGTVGFGVQITTAGGGTSSPARGGSGPPAPPALRWSTSPSATRPSENLGGFAVYDNPTAARTPDTASSFAAGAQQEAYDHTYHLIHGNAAARGRSSTGFESRSWWGSPAGPGWQPLAFDSAQGAFQIPDSLPRSPIGSPGRRGLSLGSASPLWQAEASVSRNQRSDSWSRGSPPDEARGIQGPAVLRTEPSDRPTVAAAQERVIHASPPSAPRPRHLSFSEAADAADIAYASLGRGSPVTARLPTSDAFCMFDMSPELPYGSASLSPPPRAWRPPSFPETEAAADAAFEELRRLYPSSPPRPYDSAGGFDLGRPRFQFSSAVDDVGAAFHFAESFQEAPARHVFDDSRYLDPVRHSARWESLAREAKRAPPLRPGPPSERGSAATGASASLRHYHNGVPMDEGEEDGDEWPHSVFRDYSATEDAHELMRKHMADAIVSLSKLQVPDGSPDSPALAARLEGQGGAPPPVDGPLQPSPAGPPEGESLEEVCRRLLSASGFLGPLKDADLREALQKLLRMQTERLKVRKATPSFPPNNACTRKGAPVDITIRYDALAEQTCRSSVTVNLPVDLRASAFACPICLSMRWH